jgi:hypothetical protein
MWHFLVAGLAPALVTCCEMLSELLRLLEENPGELNLSEIGRRLNAHPSAVAGMLETLIRKGRVVELGADCGVCSDCSLQANCALPARRVRRFQLSQSTISENRPAGFARGLNLLE